ncbi:glycoside hydrolase family 99-like domain-containing protein [Halorussus amylolyticus]|uniref:glycoside hydrolase family 99-like domain-containing protein n=1 Tax=Halorussus amylolyticus TaxID=1126242 RepID=UPI00138EF29A|nr:glycoside hydrolase family 99-like domain-containing protein [Halorussus amylolyticus]
MLTFHLEGQDEQELQAVVVSYGDKTERTDVEGETVTLDGEFTDLQQASLSDRPGRVRFRLVNTAGQETTATLVPDETAPELLGFSAEPTKNVGEIALSLEGRDDVGLEHVAALLGEEPRFQESVSGQQEYSTDRVIDTPEDATFQQNTVTAFLEDWNGNATEGEADTYVRKYDSMDETQMDIGTYYLPFTGEVLAEVLPDDIADPASEYDQPYPRETVSRHIDQMTGHGIDRLIYTYSGRGTARRTLENVLESDLTDQIDIHAKVTHNAFAETMDQSWKEDVVPEDMEFLRKNIIERDNAATYDGRPVFNFWWVHAFVYVEEERAKLMDEWGSYEAFVEDIRSRLTVDGVEPFLVANMGPAATGYEDDEFRTMATQWDGISTWTGPDLGDHDGGETYDWEEVITDLEAQYSATREFTTNNDMEFFPTVFPGFDDRANARWGDDRHIPRSTDRFEEILQMAAEYATTDMINVATWNDWAEGTQIEPGSFRGTDYGTVYLEIIKQFQQPD